MSNSFGEHVMDWIDINKSSIAIGVICGLAGIVYGVTKAADITNKIWMRGLRQDFSEVEHEQE